MNMCRRGTCHDNSKKRNVISKIIPTTEIVFTYDIGVGFTLITSSGVYEEIGGNYSDWPLYKFPGITERSRRIITHSIETRMFSLEMLKGTSLEAFAALVDDYNKNYEDKKIPVSDFQDSLYTALHDTRGDLFAFCSLESWKHEIKFFPSYHEMEQDFVARYVLSPWAEFNEEKISQLLEIANDPGICYYTADSVDRTSLSSMENSRE